MNSLRCHITSPIFVANLWVLVNPLARLTGTCKFATKITNIKSFHVNTFLHHLNVLSKALFCHTLPSSWRPFQNQKGGAINCHQDRASARGCWGGCSHRKSRLGAKLAGAFSSLSHKGANRRIAKAQVSRACLQKNAHWCSKLSSLH